MHSSQRQGLSLVEVVIGTAIVLIFIIGMLNSFSLFTRLSLTTVRSTQAGYLAEEGVEAVRNLRDFSWQTNIVPLSTATAYYLSFSTSTNRWSVNTTPTLIDSVFDRQIRIATVARDSNQDITTSGGTVDPNIKQVTVTVSWAQNSATSSKTITTYLTNLFSN